MTNRSTISLSQEHAHLFWDRMNYYTNVEDNTVCYMLTHGMRVWCSSTFGYVPDLTRTRHNTPEEGYDPAYRIALKTPEDALAFSMRWL